MAEPTNADAGPVKEDFQRLNDFKSYYANNIQFEWSQFDLKLIFGQLEQSTAKARIMQHSAVTLPWVQAKLAVYYLQLQVAFFEMLNGKIKISRDLIPQEIPTLTEEQKQDPNFQDYFQLFTNIRNQFISSL